MAATLHVGDTTELLVQVTNEDGVAVNLSTAATLQILLRKPDGTSLAKTATPGSLAFPLKTAALGWMRYATVPSDFVLAGQWSLQGVVVIGASQWHTEVLRVQVNPNLT